MDELLRLLNISCAPGTDEKEFIRVSCCVGFEPHGIASETWEIFWKLELPQIPYHWKSTAGWRRGATDKPMTFSGRTFENIVQRAIVFLRETQSG